MKKFLSVVLTLMMVFSVFTTVSAAEPTLSELINQYLNPPADPNEPILSFNNMKVKIEGKRSGTSDAYQETDLILSDSGLAAGIGVDFQTTLYMKDLRDFFANSAFITQKLSGSALDEFRNGTVSTTVTVTIDYPGATVADTTLGGLTNDNGIFKITTRTLDPSGNKLTIIFDNDKNGINSLKVGDLIDNVTTRLADLTFVLDNAAAKYSTEGTHEVKVTMEAKTKVTFTNAGYFFVDYKGEDTYKVIADIPSTGGGGTTKYSLTYETNGGSPIDKETYTRNATAKLTKVPKKEGYIFEGWYLDKELTERVTEVKMIKNTTVYAGWVEDNGLAGNGYDTPEKLNGDDHFAYIIGYPEGDVRPSNNITRAEVTTIFFRLLKEDVRNMNLAYENSFGDVEILDWYNTAVSTMAKLGVVNGRNADTFDPNAFITRAEFAAICARFADADVDAENKFTDVAGHWAEKEIYEAAEYGWIRGYEDNTFKPDQYITRAEAMTLINRVLNRIPETADDLLDTMKKWSDNSDVSVWYYIPVQEATNSHNYNKKNNVYEKWTSLTENIDWTKYEK